MKWIVRIRWVGMGVKSGAFEAMEAYIVNKPLALTAPTLPEFEWWCINWFGVRWPKDKA